MRHVRPDRKDPNQRKARMYLVTRDCAGRSISVADLLADTQAWPRGLPPSHLAIQQRLYDLLQGYQDTAAHALRLGLEKFHVAHKSVLKLFGREILK